MEDFLDPAWERKLEAILYRIVFGFSGLGAILIISLMGIFFHALYKAFAS